MERQAIAITTIREPSAESWSAGARVPRAARVHAARVPTPRACGCGRAVVFDLDKHEFFCVGCGAGQVCVCVRSPFTSTVRPVQVP